MASLDDYDEFGNYIGADLDSDDDEEIQNDFIREPEPQPLEGFDEEPIQAHEESALMEVDGLYSDS